MLSFDEFRAVENRKRAQKRTVDDKDMDEDPPAKSEFFLGDFLELHEVQTLVIILLIVDTFAAFAESSSLVGTKIVSSSSNIESIMLRMLQSITQFSMIFFACEVLALFLAFRFSFLIHLGYIMDTCVIGFEVYLESIGYGKRSHLLNIFRFWRLIRLFRSMVASEVERYDVTKIQVEELEIAKKDLSSKIKLMEVDIVKEQEARLSVEEMLQSYKDEVDTLNEALKIAAQDIAEVAEADDDDIYDSDYEEGGLEGGGLEGGLGRVEEGADEEEEDVDEDVDEVEMEPKEGERSSKHVGNEKKATKGTIDSKADDDDDSNAYQDASGLRSVNSSMIDDDGDSNTADTASQGQMQKNNRSKKDVTALQKKADVYAEVRKDSQISIKNNPRAGNKRILINDDGTYQHK